VSRTFVPRRRFGSILCWRGRRVSKASAGACIRPATAHAFIAVSMRGWMVRRAQLRVWVRRS
jgi:hypothetical protein